MTTTSHRVLDHLLTACLSVIATGVAFYLLESRHHLHRAEFESHLRDTAPIIRQMDEERGRVDARLAAIEAQLVELASLLRELHREAREDRARPPGQGGR